MGDIRIGDVWDDGRREYINIYNGEVCHVIHFNSLVASEADANSTNKLIKSLTQDLKTCREELAARDAQYEELIMAVAMKYPGETRHETALRIINDNQTQSSDQAECSGQALNGGE